MQIINGYYMVQNFTADNAGFCKWGFAEKDGYTYFIKEFLSPKYPLDTHKLSEQTMNRKKQECIRFYEEKNALYEAIQSCRSGNVVIVHDFFREGSRYYAVTEKVAAPGYTVEQVCKISTEKKLVLFRGLLYSFSQLHSKGIVHGDIKPENILIKKTKVGYYTGKIIDFDSGFLQTSVPEDIQGDQVFLAPEVRLHIADPAVPVTTKADVFSLGILFHLYWSGKLPEIPEEYAYTFEAVLDNVPPKLDSSIPKVIRNFIGNMLQNDATARPSASQILNDLEMAIRRSKSRSEPGDGKKRGFYAPNDLG